MFHKLILTTVVSMFVFSLSANELTNIEFDTSSALQTHITCKVDSSYKELHPELLNHLLTNCFTENGRTLYSMQILFFAVMILSFSEEYDEDEYIKMNDVLKKHNIDIDQTTFDTEEKMSQWVDDIDIGEFASDVMSMTKKRSSDPVESRDIQINGTTAKILVTRKSENGKLSKREYTYLNINSNWLVDSWADI